MPTVRRQALIALCLFRAEGGTVLATRHSEGMDGTGRLLGDPGIGQPMPGFFCLCYIVTRRAISTAICSIGYIPSASRF
jgi:hypothetical protein